MRIAVALAMLALASPASAGPGGKLGGSFTASWQTGAWNGQVSMALDPGDAARDAAVRKIKSGQHVRTGYPFFPGGAHVTGLASVGASSFDCGKGDGRPSRRPPTSGAVSDADTPFFVNRPELD